MVVVDLATRSVWDGRAYEFDPATTGDGRPADRSAATPDDGQVVGFTSSVPMSDLVALGRELSIPVMEDLGSGMLFDMTPYGLPREPTVAETIAAGIDIVTFSGDKLLGGLFGDSCGIGEHTNR